MGLLHIIEAVAASADVDAAVAFHAAAFDLEPLVRTPDGQVVVGVPGSPTGRIRFVPALGQRGPGPPNVWDPGPRLLGIYSRALATTVARIRAAGGRSGDPVRYAYGPSEMSEVLATGTDGIWWTIPAVPAAPRPSPALSADPARNHSELHTAVLVVSDHDAALRFFVDAGGLRTVFDGTLAGESFERLVAIPSGATLRLSFLVGPDETPARLELMSFTGVPATAHDASRIGLRGLVFAADRLKETREALLAAGAEPIGSGLLRGPVGIEIALIDAAAHGWKA